jgi:outer membrane protein OmpA-like peptidoglycan-associated protein
LKFEVQIFVVALILQALCVQRLSAQNLVPNPGFEDYISCPGSFSQNSSEFRVKGWITAGTGTPDHFHSCSAGEADVPYNWAGVSDPFEGYGYAGIYTWMGIRDNYREYLQCKLIEPLVRDSTYIIEFHFKLSSYSKYCINRMGLLLSDTIVRANHDRVLPYTPTLEVTYDSALTELTGYWESIRQEYRAKGAEQFLTIGNFSNDEATAYYYIQFRPVQQEMLANSAYYYVDDVKVIPKFSPALLTIAEKVQEFTAGNAELNKTYLLRNIHFQFDSYKLLSSSFRELDDVVLWMKQHPDAKVHLSGHTDDVGGDRYNLTLSQNRSKSVAAYLISQGIGSNRIETYGYGKREPLIESTSEEARQLNRRVEIRFVE